MLRNGGLFLRLNARRFAIGALVLAFGVLLSTARADAQSSDWTGAQDSNWLNSNNWTNGVPTGDTLIDTVTPNQAVLKGPAGIVTLLDVGELGTGQLTIANGGNLGGVNAVIGGGAGSAGTVTVDGAGSIWSLAGVRIGINGIGNLVVQNGGTVLNSTDSTIAQNAGSIGLATVDGPGSTWTISGTLFLGIAGAATLTVNNGGIVSATSIQAGGSNASLNIGAAVGQAAAAPGVLDTPTVRLTSSADAIVFNHTSDNYIFAPTILGSGSVDVRAGTTIFSANSSYSGATTVNGGALIVNGSIASSSTLVNSGGTLGGSGIVGNTSINGGTLAPGSATGTLTVQGNLSFTAASTYMVEVSPSSVQKVSSVR